MASTTSGKDSTEYSYQASSTDTLDQSPLENTVSDDSDNVTCLSMIKSKMLGFGTHLSNLRLEIVAFLFMFSYTMTSVTSTTMIIDKVCLVHFGYTSSICNNLDNFTEIKTSIEKVATNFQLGHSLLQTAPAAVLACFIGPWSDRYGRKFPIIMALVGIILDTIGSTVCAFYLETRAEYYLIPAVFTGLFGGQVSILAVIYSYASDCTTLLERTMKYAFIAMASGFAQPFGSAAGGWIFKYLGYPAVFFFSFGGLCLSLILVVLLLKETRGLDTDDSWAIKLRKLFSCKTFAESFIAIAKERPHKGRNQVVLLIISTSFLVIGLNSTGDINYLFAHHQFGWSNTTYSTITSIYSIIAIVFLVIVIPLIRRFRFGDPCLGLWGTVSMLGKAIGMGLAWKRGIYHAANVFGIFAGVASFAARSRISKVVSTEDIGKVFSFVSAAEALFPILTSVLMSQLFNAFLESFPGMPYIVLAIFLVFPFGVFCWMTRLPKMSYEDINRATQNTEDVICNST